MQQQPQQHHHHSFIHSKHNIYYSVCDPKPFFYIKSSVCDDTNEEEEEQQQTSRDRFNSNTFFSSFHLLCTFNFLSLLTPRPVPSCSRSRSRWSNSSRLNLFIKQNFTESVRVTDKKKIDVVKEVLKKTYNHETLYILMYGLIGPFIHHMYVPIAIEYVCM